MKWDLTWLKSNKEEEKKKKKWEKAYAGVSGAKILNVGTHQ